MKLCVIFFVMQFNAMQYNPNVMYDLEPIALYCCCFNWFQLQNEQESHSGSEVQGPRAEMVADAIRGKKKNITRLCPILGSVSDWDWYFTRVYDVCIYIISN